MRPARQQSKRGACPADPVCPPTARRYAALDEERDEERDEDEEILSEEEGGADEEKYELQDHYASDELATTLAAGGFALDAGSGCYYNASSGLWFDARTALYWPAAGGGVYYRWDADAQAFQPVEQALEPAESAGGEASGGGDANTA